MHSFNIEFDIQEYDKCAACGNIFLQAFVFENTYRLKKSGEDKGLPVIGKDGFPVLNNKSVYLYVGDPFNGISEHNRLACHGDSATLKSCPKCSTVIFYKQYSEEEMLSAAFTAYLKEKKKK